MKVIEQKQIETKNIFYQLTDANTFQNAKDITTSWDNSLSFIKEDIATNTYGLRNPQIGAIHAVLSHWSYSDEIATIVMPTGTGKTETMLSLLIQQKCEKLLVIVPTDPLRKQIADKFVSLGMLKKLKIINPATFHPVVGVISHNFNELENANSFIEKCNVIVATASIFDSFSDDVLNLFKDKISHIFIDEAHHAEANSWFKIRDKFINKRVLQFTATPFRNDGKRIKGKIIYNYPLKKAQEEGYFKPIKFEKIYEYNPKKADLKIAEKAIEQLRKDRKENYEHLLMARVNSTIRADEIFEIYSLFTDFKVVKIHSKSGTDKERLVARQAILNGDADIVICVDMLGEGFDLPQLKIAAFHDIRKSLPVTLQFIGRFTRSSRDANLGQATIIANRQDDEMEDVLNELYSQDADWNKLLPDISSQKTGQEVDFRQFIEGFNHLEDFPLPLENVKPAMSTVIYKTYSTIWNPNPQNFQKGFRDFENFDVFKHSLNSQKGTLVIVTGKKEKVSWANNSDFYSIQWDLYVVYFDVKNQLLFIHSSNNTSLHEKLAKALTNDSIEILSGNNEGAIFRCFHGIDYFKLQNVGLLEVIGKLIRYNQHIGTDVKPALTQAELKRTKKAVIFGIGYEKGSKVTLGCSYKGRIWSWKVSNLSDFVEFCDKIGKKVTNSNINVDELLKGTLKPIAIDERPYVFPYAIDWHESIYSEIETRYTFRINEQICEFYNTSIVLIDESDTGNIIFGLEYNDVVVAKFELKLFKNDNDNSDFSILQISPYSEVKVYYGKKEVSANEFFRLNPPSFWFVDGSLLEDGNSYVKVYEDLTPYDPNKIIEWDWSGVDLRVESQDVNPKKVDSIQFHCIQRLKKGNYDIIFDDDASGEIADIVTIKKDSDKLIVELYHLKFAKKGKISKDIGNLTEVCSQAQKCFHWKTKSSKEFLDHLLRRESLRMSKYNDDLNCSRFEKGAKKDLEEMLTFRKIPIEYKVYIVQPSISKSKISQMQLTLLSVVEDYLKTKALIDLIVIGGK
jgi:superfamily II DNA or RNA helicase